MDKQELMDKKDSMILSELEGNSRQSVRDISRKTKIRPSTVHLRIQKLIQDGFIKCFTIRLNREKLGQTLTVFMLVSTNGNIPDSFFKSPNIVEVFGITGEYDLIIKCRFRDVGEFNRFILEFRNFPQINKTLTMVGTLRLKKEV